MKCAAYCPEGAIKEKEVDGKKILYVDLRYCKGCGICEQVCPLKAIEMKEKRFKI